MMLEGILEGQSIDDGAQHSHGVRRGSIHTGTCAGGAPPDVPSAHHHRELQAELVAGTGDFARQLLYRSGIDGLV
jgi:hypothetical protein